MPSGFDTYVLYISLKNHFSRPSYSYFLYNGKTSVKCQTFERRRDRYFFEKLGSRYPREKLIDLFVANFVENPNIWIGDLLDGQADETYVKWKTRVESLSYKFTEECDGILKWLVNNNRKFNDLFQVSGHDHPIIVKMVLQKIITLETFIIFDRLLGFCTQINRKLDDPIWENLFLRVIKYSPFLSVDENRCKSSLRNKIETEFPSVIL